MDPALAQRKFGQFSIRRIIFQHQYMDVTLHERPDNYTIPSVRTLNRVKDPPESAASGEWRVTGRENRSSFGCVVSEKIRNSRLEIRNKFETRRQILSVWSPSLRRHCLGFRTSDFEFQFSVHSASQILQNRNLLPDFARKAGGEVLDVIDRIEQNRVLKILDVE